MTEPRADYAEIRADYDRLIARRDELILAGVDPAELLIPEYPLPPPGPRSWSLPPEPPAGTRLRGIVTVLRDGADHPCEYQRDTVFPDLWVEVGASHRRFTWGELLTREGPLTEVVDSEPEPYRCEGCGKTSRIAAHESWCPVYATPLRSARRDRG